MEDISSFFPNNSENRRVNEAYQKIGDANRILVTFSQVDHSQGICEELLMDAAAGFAKILLENDPDQHIKEVFYEVDNEQISQITNFITQNLPYFLEESDFWRMDSLLESQAIEKQLQANREILMSPMGGFVQNVILNDPLHFSQNALKNLDVFRQNDRFNTDNGFIFNDRGECIVIITSNYPVSETNNNRLLAVMIDEAIRQTIKEFDYEITIVPFGATLISITNAEQIKRDSLFAVSVALVLILALLFYFFRNAKNLFLIALSVTFGALFSLGVIALLKTTVSIIAIGVASIIFGIAINYPLHFLVHYQQRKNLLNTIKILVNPLLIGNITTVGAFLSILFISSDAMKDLGMFSSFLLIGTIVFVLIFLPHFLLPKKTQKHETPREYGILGKIAEFSPEKNKFIVLIFLIFTVVLYFFSFGVKFETNLHAINFMTTEQRTEMNKLMEQNAGKQTLYVVAEGETIEEALQNYEKYVLPNLNHFSEISGISSFFPSKALQQQRIERWNEFWSGRKPEFMDQFNRLSREAGFTDRVFDQFLETLNTDFQPQAFNYFEPIFHHLGENYFSISDDNVLIYTMIRENVSDAGSFTIENPAVFAFNDASIAQKMVSALSDDFNKVLYICAFIVFLFLFFSFGRIELAVMTFIPLAVAWIWILGLMNIFDMRFNIVNIILATFIFGQGDDYTIFVTEGLIYEYSRRKKMLASFKKSIFLSAAILFIAIGMLIFAKHPAMRSLAELAIIGMVSVVVCAFLFPPLLFKFLTTKKRKPREVPWTLTRFLRMLYAFVVFLVGSLLITVCGFFLLGFRRKPSERNKLRYHKLLQWAAQFVICRVPGVKFCFENPANETFDKPAVIIANHQSHLDLMCLMMLTPKLIILTNDWVWNSPFYGQLIRFAEFYPVSQGIENSVEQLSDAVKRGYSIVIFPEGTRSQDCSINRFRRGAFYLAETLKLDIVPVFLHGVGHVLPKNDFLLRNGQITVQVQQRITPEDRRFTSDYQTRSKQVRQYYREVFAEMRSQIETIDYFKSFVMHNYIYKGVEIWRGAKSEMKNIDLKLSALPKTEESQVVIKNNGYGVFSFLYALANKEKQIVAIEEDKDKVAIAKSCAGIPENLKVLHQSEFENELINITS